MDIKLTKEQKNIINTLDNEQKIIVVDAYAGASKTTVVTELIKEIKKREPEANIFYTCFGKDMLEESKSKFKKLGLNVDCYTAHAFALKRLSKIKKIKVVMYLDYDFYKKNKLFKYSTFLNVKSLIDGFCLSTENIDVFVKNCQNEYNCTYDDIDEFKNIYQCLIDNNMYLHSMYLKEYSNIDDKIEDYDYIMIDESNDLDSHMLKILNKMSYKKMYFVGDGKQNIFSFRNTVNALNIMALKDKSNVYPLSVSFRFGDNIATLANNILSKHPEFDIKRPIKGFEKKQKLDNNKTTVLFRLNSTMLEWACSHAKEDVSIELSGIINGRSTKDFCELYLDFLTLLKLLAQERRDEYLASEVDIHFFTPNMSSRVLKMKKIAKEEGMSLTSYLNKQVQDCIWLDGELIRYFKFIQNNYSNIINKLKMLQKCQENKNREKYYYLTTVFRAKGLEYPTVIIPEDNWMEYNTDEEYITELNVAYVAVSRCQENLIIESETIKELCKIND